MTTGTSIVALGLVSLLSAGPFVWAQTSSGASGGAPSASPATSASLASGDFMGRHTMTGEITEVDAASGKFSLKTGEGTLELHAPPAALAGVKQGDRMTVEIAVKPMT
jgi:hypothetical protein